MRRNLHTHSFYCGHGKGTISEYTRFAEKNDFKMLGFTEHCPLPDNRYSDSRMLYNKMPLYEEDVEREKRESSIDIYLGYECDYLPEYKNYHIDLAQRTDYLIAGTHYILTNGIASSPFFGKMSKRELFSYANQTIAAIETNLFSFITHPDVFCSSYEPFDSEAVAITKDIVDACKQYNMALEVNGGGILKPKVFNSRNPYPHPSFWEIVAKEKPLVVYNTDAHRPEDLLTAVPLLEEFMDKFDFKQAEIESIKDGRINFRKE